MMKPSFDNAMPIFEQLADMIRRDIISGRAPPGSRVTPVRELALNYGVNPNTMQRALALLESEGMIRTERTSGRYVTDDGALIHAARVRICGQAAREYAAQMREAGLSRGEAVTLVEQYWEE